MAPFDLTTNPFWLLKTSIRARARDVVAALELAVSNDPASELGLMRAQQILLAPMTRLDAELSWLPELSPERAGAIVGALATSPPKETAIRLLDGLEGVSRVNVAADICRRYPGDVALVDELVRSYQGLSLEAGEESINASRTVAGFGQVDSAMMKSAFTKAERAHADAATSCLAATARPGKAFSALIDGTEDPTSLRFEFLDATMRAYRAWSEPQLRRIDDAVQKQIDSMKSSPGNLRALRSLSAGIELWSELNHPVVLWDRAKGLDEPRAYAIYGRLRDLSLWLANDMNQYEEALEITECLRDNFASLPSFSKQLDEDVTNLRELIRIAPLMRVRKLCQSVLADGHTQVIREQDKSEHNSPICRAMLARFRSEVQPSMASDLAAIGAEHPAAKVLRGEVALCLNSIATAFTWADEFVLALQLRQEALAIGVDTDAVEVISRGIAQVSESARQQKLLGEPVSVMKIPSLQTINGSGCMLYGSSDRDTLTNSFATTYYLTFLFFPLFPIRRYRVIRNGKSYRFLGILPLRTADKWHRGIVLTFLACLVAFCLLVSGGGTQSGQSAYSTTSSSSASEPTTTSDLKAPIGPDTAEVEPPVGEISVYSRPELRYCVFQKARIERAKTSSINNAEIDNVNRAVEDFNARCSKFTYDGSDMATVQAELQDEQSKINEDTQSLVKGGDHQ